MYEMTYWISERAERVYMLHADRLQSTVNHPWVIGACLHAQLFQCITQLFQCINEDDTIDNFTFPLIMTLNNDSIQNV